MTPASIVLSVAALLAALFCGFLSWQVYYGRATNETAISAGVVFVVFALLSMMAAAASATP